MNFPFFVALMVLQPWLCNQKFIPIISVVGKILCQGKPAKDIDVSIDLFSPSHAQTKTDGKGVFHLKAYSDLNHRKFWSRISIRHKCYANEEDKEVCFTRRNHKVPKRYIGPNKPIWNIGSIELYKPGKKCVKKDKLNVFRGMNFEMS